MIRSQGLENICEFDVHMKSSRYAWSAGKEIKNSGRYWRER